MTKQILILGTCEPEPDTQALGVVMRIVAENHPDELVLFDQSTRLLEMLREVYDGPIGAHAGDPDPRFGVAELPEVYEIAPGWISTARSDGYEVSTIAGNTAHNAAQKFGKSVVMGHTHKMGLVSYSSGFGGAIDKTVTGMEVGTLLSRKHARRVAGQQGFGQLTLDGSYVVPQVVPFPPL